MGVGEGSTEVALGGQRDCPLGPNPTANAWVLTNVKYNNITICIGP